MIARWGACVVLAAVVAGSALTGSVANVSSPRSTGSYAGEQAVGDAGALDFRDVTFTSWQFQARLGDVQSLLGIVGYPEGYTAESQVIVSAAEGRFHSWHGVEYPVAASLTDAATGDGIEALWLHTVTQDLMPPGDYSWVLGPTLRR